MIKLNSSNKIILRGTNVGLENCCCETFFLYGHCICNGPSACVGPFGTVYSSLQTQPLVGVQIPIPGEPGYEWFHYIGQFSSMSEAVTAGETFELNTDSSFCLAIPLVSVQPTSVTTCPPNFTTQTVSFFWRYDYRNDPFNTGGGCQKTVIYQPIAISHFNITKRNCTWTTGGISLRIQTTLIQHASPGCPASNQTFEEPNPRVYSFEYLNGVLTLNKPSVYTGFSTYPNFSQILVDEYNAY